MCRVVVVRIYICLVLLLWLVTTLALGIGPILSWRGLAIRLGLAIWNGSGSPTGGGSTGGLGGSDLRGELAVGRVVIHQSARVYRCVELK